MENVIDQIVKLILNYKNHISSLVAIGKVYTERHSSPNLFSKTNKKEISKEILDVETFIDVSNNVYLFDILGQIFWEIAGPRPKLEVQTQDKLLKNCVFLIKSL